MIQVLSVVSRSDEEFSEMTVTLEVEGHEPQASPSSLAVESWLRKLRSVGKYSYATLSKENGEYIQVAGGRVTWVLEHRTAQGVQSRAFLSSPRTAMRGGLTMSFAKGNIVAFTPEECLFIDDVVLAFHSFINDEPFPGHIYWRTLDENYG